MKKEERRTSPMKKKLVVLLAAVMLLASTTTALAAPSAGKDDVTIATVAELAAAVKGATSEAGEVKVEAVSANSEAALALEEAVIAVLNKTTTDDKAKVLAMADISLPEGTDVSAGVKIKVAVDGINSTDSADTIVALHFDGTNWESDTIKVVAVEKGFVTIEVKALSPIAFVKVVPKAGTFGVGLSVLPLVAVAGLAGAVVTGKKANK